LEAKGSEKAKAIDVLSEMVEEYKKERFTTLK